MSRRCAEDTMAGLQSGEREGDVRLGPRGSKHGGKPLKCVQLDRNVILLPLWLLFPFLLSLNTGSLLSSYSPFWRSLQPSQEVAYFYLPRPPCHWMGQGSSSFLFCCFRPFFLKTSWLLILSLQQPPPLTGTVSHKA